MTIVTIAARRSRPHPAPGLADMAAVRRLVRDVMDRVAPGHLPALTDADLTLLALAVVEAIGRLDPHHLQSAWDDSATLPPLTFTPTEAGALLAGLIRSARG